MRPVLLIALSLSILGAMTLLWTQGSFDDMARWAAAMQRDFQNAMAGALHRLRAGENGATFGLLVVCFAYGFFHAIGPGHGKILIGGYGLGTRVPLPRLVSIALVSSLGQAVTAICLVYAGVLALGWGSKQLVGAAEDYFAPASYAAIAAVGAWLVLRGGRKLWRNRRANVAPHPHTHDHPHQGHGELCSECGHRHGPTAAEMATAQTLRDMAVLVGAIAIRPCTGAIFLLILTWRMDIVTAGILGTFAMALGTASITITTALAAVGFRETTLHGLADAPLLRLAVPVLELAAGAFVVTVATQLLRSTF